MTRKRFGTFGLLGLACSANLIGGQAGCVRLDESDSASEMLDQESDDKERRRAGAGGGGGAGAGALDDEREAKDSPDTSQSSNGGRGAASRVRDRIVGDGCAFADSADWRTKDGRLLVKCDDGIGLLDVDVGKFSSLVESNNASDFVLSDSTLVWLDAKQLFSIPQKGGERTTLAIDVISELQYSTDRSVAVFERGFTAGSRVPVVAVHTDGKSKEQPVVEAYSSGATLLPDGRHVLFNSGLSELAIAEIGGANPPQPLGRGFAADVLVSPTGHRLAFYDREIQHVVVAGVGKEVRRLGDSSPEELKPYAFSEDETALVVGHKYDYAESNIILLAVDGSAATVVGNGKRCLGAGFGATGSLLTLQETDSATSPELWLSAHGEDRMLGRVERCNAGGDSRAVLSPDKSRAVFVDVHGTLVVVDLERGEGLVKRERVVAVGSTCFASPTWSADGSTFLLSSCKDSSLDCTSFVVDAESGEPGPVLGMGRIERAEFSPDARYVTYTDWGGSSQVSRVNGQRIAEGYWDKAHWLHDNRFAYSAPGSRELHVLTLD